MGRKRRRGFLCFGGSSVEDDDDMDETRRRFDSCGRSNEASQIERSRNRRCSFSRSLSKILKPLALLASSRRSRKERRDSNRFIKQKEAESSEKSTNSDEDHRPQAISSSSPASCLSCPSPSSSNASSPSSSSSSSTVSASSHLLPWESGQADAKKLSLMQIARSKKPLPLAMARIRNYRCVTASFLFLSSLTLMVFYGRLCAILWMSSWFCYVACRSGAAKEIARGGVALRPAEIKRRN